MDGLLISRDAPIFREPRGTTFADLGLLVAGFALWLSVPLFGFRPDQVNWFQRSRDLQWFYTVSAILVEGIERFCVVLAIIALLRRVRFGGLARPGEFLLAFVAMNLLLVPSAGSMWVLELRSPAGIRIALAVFVLASLVVVRWRRRLPGSVTTALIAVGYFSTTIMALGFYEFMDQIDLFPGWSEDEQLVWQIAKWALESLPFLLVFTVPYAAALWNAREVWNRWSWLEWSGVVLATTWFFCDRVHSLTSALLSTPLWFFMANLIVSWCLTLAGFFVSLKLCRRLNPWFQGWIAKDQSSLS